MLSERDLYALKGIIRRNGYADVVEAVGNEAHFAAHEEASRDGGANPYFLAAYHRIDSTCSDLMIKLAQQV